MKLACLVLLTACGSSAHDASAPAPAPAPAPAAASAMPAAIALPGGSADGVAMDYLLYNPRTRTVWVPAGNTGSVDVISADAKLARISGFPTQELERGGKKRVVGPSAAALGATGVYIGNRGDSSVCAVDEATLARGACGKLDSLPDGIAFVATTGEVWVTTPRDKSIRILDAKTLVQKARIAFDGAPEGFAVDAVRGRFYTNLEDKDVTLAIDLASHATVATWPASCGEDGPHGLRLDETAGFLFVACSARTETLDVAHGGAQLGTIDTGDGVDDLDYSAATHRLYVAGAKSATLTIAAVDAHGGLAHVATIPTQEGARNGVVDDAGRVFLSHARASELIVVPSTR